MEGLTLFDQVDGQRTDATLEQLERVIEGGLQTFVEVGLALLDIRDRRLYRTEHATFEDYCQKRWQMSRFYAHRVMEAAKVAELLPIGNKPATESQARELAPLLRTQPEAIPDAWEDAQSVAAVEFRPVTAVDVREAVARHIPQPHVSYATGENEWYTPAPYIHAARAAMGRIDLDPASTALANETVGATTFYTAADDGLSQEWRGSVWLNPPYATPLIGQFSEVVSAKFDSGEIERACVLVNNATETAWFQRLLASAAALCFVRGRVRFIDPAGNPGAPLQGQLVVYLGEDVGRFARSFAGFGPVWFPRP